MRENNLCKRAGTARRPRLSTTIGEHSPPRSEQTASGHSCTPRSAASRMQRNKRYLIYLIYTPTTTNESTHVPSEVQTPRGNPSLTHPYLSEGTQLPREKERSGSPLLTRAVADKKKEISRLDGKKSARTSSPTLPPKPHRTHTQDLGLFRCELSKVA